MAVFGVMRRYVAFFVAYCGVISRYVALGDVMGRSIELCDVM